MEHADAVGVRVLGLTDNDIRLPQMIRLSTGEDVDIVEYAARRGATLIRGIGISCEMTAEDCHIVCFGCNWGDAHFDWLEEFVSQSRIGSYKEFVESLADDGMTITREDALYNGGIPVREGCVQKKMVF